jgi:hypothetical protein
MARFAPRQSTHRRQNVGLDKSPYNGDAKSRPRLNMGGNTR